MHVLLPIRRDIIQDQPDQANQPEQTHTHTHTAYTPHPHNRPIFTIAMFRSTYPPLPKSSRRSSGPSIVIPSYPYPSVAPPPEPERKRKKRSYSWAPFATFSNSAPPPPPQQQVRFDEATLAREREKSRSRSRGGSRRRTGEEYYDGYERKEKREKRRREGERVVSTMVDPGVLREAREARERRHSVSGGSRRGSVTDGRSGRRGSEQVQWPESIYYLGDENTQPLFLSARERERRGRHSRRRQAEETMAPPGEYGYSEKRLPAGKGLRRVKSFLWGESRWYS